MTIFLKKIQDFFKFNKKNELLFYRKYYGFSGYSSTTRYTLEKLDTIFLKFKKIKLIIIQLI